MKTFHANQIHFVMHSMDCDKCFMKPTAQVWYKKMLVAQKYASDTKTQSVVCQ